MDIFKIKPSSNKYKIYYYLKRLWSKKIDSIPYIKDNINIIQNKVTNNNILNDYKNLFPLLEPKIQLEEFKKIMKDNLNLFRLFGFNKIYSLQLHERSKCLKSEGLDNDNVNIIVKNITDADIINIYNYMNYTDIQKKKYIRKKTICNIIPQYKSGETNEPNNFRYFTIHDNVIKIIDRLWSISVLKKCGDNLPDPNIFKSPLVNPDFSEISKLAFDKTQTTKNKVFIDIQKAFDSLDWHITYKLLLANLTRKTNKCDAKKLVDEYFIILKNRNIYYENKLLDVNNGIPVGLPSTIIIFNFIMEEIILRWLNNNDLMNHFKLTIFVDDILFEFNSVDKINFILINFINYIKKYGLNINKKKFKISPNLYNKILGVELSNNDFYLGIPFTRDIQLYGTLILKSFQEKYMHRYSWNDIYLFIISNNINKNCIMGFISFKLKPLIEYISTTPNNNTKINQNTIISFIKEHYIKIDEVKIEQLLTKAINSNLEKIITNNTITNTQKLNESDNVNIEKSNKKLKIFCGITQQIPKGYRLGSMKECLEKNQVRYYGLHKIDSKLVKSFIDNKTPKLELISKMCSLRGKIDRLKKEIDSSKNVNDKKKLIEEFQSARDEILLLNEKLQKIK